MNYVDGFSPRTKLTSSVYTSTEYDKDFYISLHNELSYSAKWPSRLFFCCIIPAQEGGETLLADCRRVPEALPEGLAEAFQAKGVRCVRNLHGGGGMGPSWQQAYETESKQHVGISTKYHSYTIKTNSNVYSLHLLGKYGCTR